MITISRSAVTTRKLCPMKRYWAYHAPHPNDPTTPVGLSPVSDSGALPKTRGTVFHATMEATVAGTPPADYLATADTQGLDDEQLTLIRRAALGWAQVRTTLTEFYAPVSAEMEWQWSLHPLVTQSLRMDQILRHKQTGELLILDYKTMSRPDGNWADRMRFSEQTHLYIQALVERTQEPVSMQYEGIIIGKYEDGIQKSPFVHAYRTKQGTLSPKWSAGATRESLLGWSDAQWLTWIQESGHLHDLYCTTGPIFVAPEQLLATKNATVHAELRWADTLAQLEAITNPEQQAYERECQIERNPDACLKYGRGYACPYMGLCWEGAQVDHEQYVPRVDHHAIPSEDVS